MKIFLVRHGNAEAQASSDRERQLTAGGVEQIRSLLAKLDSSSLSGKGLVSPYLRARQTAAEIALRYPDLVFEETPMLAPETAPQELLDYLGQFAGSDLVLVSHNPLLTNLLALLKGSESGPYLHMGTANLACLQTDVVAPACAELEYFLEP